MRTPAFTKTFKKDLKRQKKRGKPRAEIETVIHTILADGDAPLKCQPHNLSGNWDGFRECHIQSDWLLIYTVDENVAIFYRTGTHSDLFH